MIDVGHIPHVEPGEAIAIIGKSEDEYISACDIADAAGTIQNEIVSSLTERLPRLYVNE
jgi:alanine racemase